jgi:RimJ/RimL family protein N-acetyltransferase
MNISKASKRDGKNIGWLHAASWSNSYRGIMSDSYLDQLIWLERNDFWVKRLNLPAENLIVWKASENRKLFGFISILTNDDPIYGTLIDNFHIHPERKGQGIGKQLFRETMRYIAKNHPKQGVYLWVFKDNLSSRKVYEHLGAKEVGSEMYENADGTKAMVIKYAWTESQVSNWL